ncbi:MAG: hypothetical protein ACI4XA_01670 [Oscillospiraceae bacterium]
MKFQISQNDIEIIELIDVSGMKSKPQIVESGDKIYIVVPDDEMEEFMLCFNEAIVMFGLDKQETVNKLGKRMYNLYDRFLSV